MTWPSYAKAALAALAAALTVAGCGGRGQPPPAPSTAELIERAEAEERTRQYDRARGLYARAMSEAPDSHSRAVAARRFASALLHWGEYEDAERALRVLVEARADDASGWHDMGILRARRGDAAGAEDALRRSISLRPREPRSRIALAALLVNQRRYREAEAEYLSLLELDLPEPVRAAIPRALELIRAEHASGPPER